MKFINLASWASKCHGYDYYKEKKVKDIQKSNDGIIYAKVKGSETYNVVICENRPRSSSCSCPFAAGRQVICKHMVATFFATHKDAVKEFEETLKEIDKEEENFNEWCNSFSDYVESLSHEELLELFWDLYNTCEYSFDFKRFLEDCYEKAKDRS